MANPVTDPDVSNTSGPARFATVLVNDPGRFKKLSFSRQLVRVNGFVGIVKRLQVSIVFIMVRVNGIMVTLMAFTVTIGGAARVSPSFEGTS
ncbi:hypothetical protein [Stackebrandtia nassauensis]|uniref:Uncharacterized protein n=1 Tax=Stackebrandtia nassauensis (strain DSM 44728 / CIP 108903 / NRRL B-16338 / NBRC 102104 / LLR-40K-21) TaxID=446470 RepID=D3PWM7_STANL|nr:hypothetical protein [Stackebrandtia nassauensis]ADD43249.1 hypothetical protein Snas_3588 [Stackebrandtia nassauensis DSM 44728]